MTTHHFVWSHEAVPVKYQIVGERDSVLDTVLISDIRECHDSGSYCSCTELLLFFTEQISVLFMYFHCYHCYFHKKYLNI
jgi:hypothetical protein